jgi:signal transduction histidine kinase
MGTISSNQWLARVGLVLMLGASEVVVAAVSGVGLGRLLVLVVATLAFVIAYLVAPSPGKASYDATAFRPIYATSIAALVAAGITGGLVSPLLPFLAVPLAIGWTMVGPRSRHAYLGALAITVLYAAPSATFSGFALLASWSVLLATAAIGRRVAQLLEVQRSQATCLSRIREGALVDAESRRRDMELMTTKLAHELKNPLAAIKSLVQVEAKQATDDKSQRRLDVTLEEIERMSSLLREYLDVARPIVDANIACVELDELMNDVMTLVAGRAEAAGVTLSLEGRGGAICADARLMKDAIVNLMCNAIEATPSGGDVAITYSHSDRAARISIRDTGRGMTRETSARVGTPFFSTREGGTGLGVAIAKTAITQHGGTLAYQSTPGSGTIATIALPIGEQT